MVLRHVALRYWLLEAFSSSSSLSLACVISSRVQLCLVIRFYSAQMRFMPCTSLFSGCLIAYNFGSGRTLPRPTRPPLPMCPPVITFWHFKQKWLCPSRSYFGSRLFEFHASRISRRAILKYRKLEIEHLRSNSCTLIINYSGDQIGSSSIWPFSNHVEIMEAEVVRCLHKLIWLLLCQNRSVLYLGASWSHREKLGVTLMLQRSFFFWFVRVCAASGHSKIPYRST